MSTKNEKRLTKRNCPAHGARDGIFGWSSWIRDQGRQVAPENAFTFVPVYDDEKAEAQFSHERLFVFAGPGKRTQPKRGTACAAPLFGWGSWIRTRVFRRATGGSRPTETNEKPHRMASALDFPTLRVGNSAGPNYTFSIKNTVPRARRGTVFLAGVAGFGPASAGVKVLCLTAWLYPIERK